MSAGYAIAHRLGLTPWERAGRDAGSQFTAMLAREEQERARPFGAALDLGCGTGAHSIELAQRGWRVTGVDAIGAAVQKARARARKEGVDVRFVKGDVTALLPEEIGADVSFFLDVGCFHGLKDRQRAAMGDRVTACAAPDATMLMLAFLPGRRGPLPRGGSRSDIEAAFAGWTVVDEEAADVAGMPGPLKKATPRWYRLRRR
jgi:SAM-dependent methyltransferase